MMVLDTVWRLKSSLWLPVLVWFFQLEVLGRMDVSCAQAVTCPRRWASISDRKHQLAGLNAM
jgi:hypothetical protein